MSSSETGTWIRHDYHSLFATNSRKRKFTRKQATRSIGDLPFIKKSGKGVGSTSIAVSQLSRGVEARQDKRAMMSDLRESGSIEQEADIVGFLYRDDYYDNESEQQNIEFILAKQRNGPTGTVELAFVKEFNKFVDLDFRYEGTEVPPTVPV